MKKQLRILILSLAVLIIAVMSGCRKDFGSIAIDTVLTVDKSFNGDRVMTADIPATVFKKAFDSDIGSIETVISKYSPGDMYCKASENSSGGARIEMHIDFASLSEYKKEIGTICKGNKTGGAVNPAVTFDYSKSMLKSGYSINENFTSLDLFYWLSDALLAEFPSLKKEDTENLFESGSTRLILNGEEIALNGSDRIHASNIESHAFDGITVETTVNNDNTIDANIRYLVSSKVVLELSAEKNRLDKLMNDLVPKSGVISSSESEDGGRAYRIKFTSATPESFITAMNKALATNNTSFSVDTKGDEDSLSVKDTYKLFFDGSYFLDYADDKTSFNYVLRVPSDCSLESCKDKYGYMSGYDSTYNNNMCEISMALGAPDEVSVELGYIVDLDSINVSTYVHDQSTVERKFVFKLSTDADSLIGEKIEENLKAVAEKWPENVKADKEKLISSVQYTMDINASSLEEITEITRVVLQENAQEDVDNNGDGRPESSKIEGGPVAPTQPLRRKYELKDIINFSKFLKGSRVSEGIEYKMTYPLYYTARFNENTSFENASSQGQTVHCSTNNQIISVESYAEKWNVEGIVVLVLWALSLIIFLIIVFFEFTNILVFFRDRTVNLDGARLFGRKGRLVLLLLTGSLVCFIIMSIRLLFRVY